MDYHLFTISLYYWNMKQEICHVSCHMPRECTAEMCRAVSSYMLVLDLGLTAMDHQPEKFVGRCGE